jgi:carotenoid cleavage dioxygenase-like enzyme
MLKMLLAGLLIFTLSNVLTVPCADGQTHPDSQNSEQVVRQAIKEIGEGYRSRVRVTLKNGTQLEGYLSTVAEDYFAVTSEKTGKTSRVAYSEVTKVVKQAPRRSVNLGPVIAVLAAAAIIVFAFVVYAISDRKG